MDKFINSQTGKTAFIINDNNEMKIFDPKEVPFLDNCYLCKEIKKGTLFKLQENEAIPHYHFVCLDCQVNHG